jgi:hypothetical protein
MKYSTVRILQIIKYNLRVNHSLTIDDDYVDTGFINSIVNEVKNEKYCPIEGANKIANQINKPVDMVKLVHNYTNQPAVYGVIIKQTKCYITVEFKNYFLNGNSLIKRLFKRDGSMCDFDDSVRCYIVASQLNKPIEILNNDQVIKILESNNIKYKYFAFDLYAIYRDQNNTFNFTLVSNKNLNQLNKIIKGIK